MDIEQKQATILEAIAEANVGFTKPGWRDAQKIADAVYNAAYSDGWNAAQTDADEHTGTTVLWPDVIRTREDMYLDWPEGAQVRDTDGDLYEFYQGHWTIVQWAGDAERNLPPYTGNSNATLASALPAEVVSTEPAETMWGFKVGDRVEYTSEGYDNLGGRVVVGLYPKGGRSSDPEDFNTAIRIDLADPDVGMDFVSGSAYSANEIRKVGA